MFVFVTLAAKARHLSPWESKSIPRSTTNSLYLISLTLPFSPFGGSSSQRDTIFSLHCKCGSICRPPPFHLASSDPPSYADSSALLPPQVPTPTSNGLHPRVAVLLGVNARWHIPLLICRALSTAPAAWWGLRCAFTFLGELLLSDGLNLEGGAWAVEKTFRVTEVFLAILWACLSTQ